MYTWNSRQTILLPQNGILPEHGASVTKAEPKDAKRPIPENNIWASVSSYAWSYICQDIKILCHVLSHVQLFAVPWISACQSPLYVGFFRQECWSGLPFPPPVDLPDPGIKSMSPASPALAGRFFTTYELINSLSYLSQFALGFLLQLRFLIYTPASSINFSPHWTTFFCIHIHIV